MERIGGETSPNDTSEPKPARVSLIETKIRNLCQGCESHTRANRCRAMNFEDQLTRAQRGICGYAIINGERTVKTSS